MCNCLSETQANLLSCLKVSEAGKHKIRSSECQNAGISIINNHLVLRSFNKVIVDVVPIKRDGTLGQPRFLHKLLLHTHCPFCGQRFEKAEINPPEASATDH